jgi:cell division protein FtsA
MVGTRLETEMYLVTIGSSPAMNLRKAVERAGYKVKELVLEPLASALAVLTEDEKELGVALSRWGPAPPTWPSSTKARSATSGRSPFGGNNVTSDIVHGLGVTQLDAERLKERTAAPTSRWSKAPAQIIAAEHGGAGGSQIPRELLAHIIHQRMDEIFDLVLRDIEERPAIAGS